MSQESGNSISMFGSEHELCESDFSNPQKKYFLFHGFGSNKDEMSLLAERISGDGNICYLFDYDSFCGIDTAAQIFLELLEALIKPESSDDRLECIFVGHSMGGLLARTICLGSTNILKVKMIITLGTPNIGTKFSKRYVRRLAEVIDACYFGQHREKILNSRSLRQMCEFGCDDEILFMTALNNESKKSNKVPIMSISGGNRRLNFGGNKIKNILLNNQIQKLLDNAPNDGLIPEKCSDIREAFNSDNHFHYNTYTEFGSVNHFTLTKNQLLAFYVRGLELNSSESQSESSSK